MDMTTRGENPLSGKRPDTGEDAADRVPHDALVDFPLTLRDGVMVHVRPIRPDDAARLRAFHARVSPDSIMFRYFRALPVLSQDMVDHLTQIDYATRMALVATVGTGSDEQIIAVVRYEDVTAHEAEVAFLVEDGWQGHGIATALLHRLATYARARGYTTFVAEVMESNHRMREVLRMAGFPHSVDYQSGYIEERLDITNDPVVTFDASRHH